MNEVSLANETPSFKEEGGAMPDDVLSNAPPPAPPLPPSLLLGDSLQNQKRRIRSFTWKPIPEERIKQQERPNLWSLGRYGGEPTFHIDITAIEEHFGQHGNDTQSSSLTGRKMAQRRGSMKDLRQRITILDFKRSINVSIFLKHLKKSVDDLLDDLLHGSLHETYSVESLRSLLKLLPEDEEVRTLQMFSGDPKDLTTADAFMYRLIHVPRYQLRVEALLLKREFFPSCLTMKQEITVVQTAITEILKCEELHNVLHLVLQAGNLINAGGFAGNAVGFKLSSLLSLADTKANKPGINLMHFVALEAQKKNLLMFPEKLLHVQQAAHLCVESINVELSSLSRRLHQVQINIHTDDDLQTQLHSFLKSADEALRDLKLCCDEMVNEGNTLIDFFCEDKETFKLHECFHIFHNFCSKFKKAVQENAEREMWEESRRKRLKESQDKRHSWTGHEGVRGDFGLWSSSEAALKREGLLDLLRTRPQNPLSPVLEFGNVRRIRKQKLMDHRDTQTLPPIHNLSITHSASEIHTHNDTNTTHLHKNHTIKTKSEQDNSTTNFNPEESKIQETQKHNQQSQQAPKDEQDEEMTFDPSHNQTEVSADGVPPTSQCTNQQVESLRTGGGPIQLNPSRTNTSLMKHRSSSKPSSSSSSPKTSSSFSKSSQQRTLNVSETQSLRKVIPISRPGPQKSPSRGAPNITSAKKRESIRPTSEEKMCRSTLRALATPTVPNLTRYSQSRPAPGFTRDTVASTTRHGVAPADRSNQPLTANPKRSPLTRTASLRLSQTQKQGGDPKKSSSVISKNISQGSLDKSVKPTWK